MVRNGRHKTVSKGYAIRWQCRNDDCRYNTTKYERPVSVVQDGYEFRTTQEKVFQSIALIALGLPFLRVEKLMGMKGETIRKHLRILRGEPQPHHGDEAPAQRDFMPTADWQSLKTKLVECYGFKEDDLDLFDIELGEIRRGGFSVGERARAYAGKVQGSERVILARRMKRILGRPVRISPNGDIRFFGGDANRQPRATRQG